jgi:broad specificity phosphatase PhoE
LVTVIVARHGQTEHNAAGRYQGHGDAPLTDTGRTQARRLGSRLATLVNAPDTRFVSSDLRRAVATAEIALPGLAVASDARLREMNFGVFEGLTHEECLSRHGVAYRAWLGDPVGNAVPGGEAFRDFEARVEAWLADQPDDGTTIAITHGGPAFVLMARLLRVPFDEARQTGLAHGEAIRLELAAR